MQPELIKYLVSLFLFGSNGVVASYIDLSSYEIVYLRTLIGCVVIILFFFLGKNRPTFHKKPKQVFFVALSGACMGAGWIFLYEAFEHIGVGISSLLYYCGPVIVMILSPIIFREKLTVIKLVGFVAVVAGLFFVNGTDSGNSNSYFGLFCGVMSAFMLAGLIIFNKMAKGIDGFENSMLQMFFTFLTVAVFMLFKQGLKVEFDRSDIFPIIFQGVVNSGLGCYLYFSSIGKLHVQTVAVCGYLEPLSAVLFSVVILGERMLPLQVLGAVLIIGGAFVSEVKLKGLIKPRRRAKIEKN